MTSEGILVGGTEGDDHVIALDDEDADELFEVLSSERHRAILRSLQQRRATTDELADRLDVPAESIGVALDRLHEAGLVEPTETTDPSVGETTTVYEPTDRAVVRYGDGPVPDERIHLRHLVVAGGILAAVSVALLLFGGTEGSVSTSILFFTGGALVLFGWAGFRSVFD